MKKRILIVGASRGIGAELVRYFSGLGHKVIGVSRSTATNCEWIKADLSTSEGIQHVINHVGQTPLDAMIYSSGIWEDEGFIDNFDFRNTHEEETRKIVSVNLIAPIELTKGLAKNLSESNNPRAIYMGALSGLEHLASDQVAYSASKFGLRGAIQGLRKALHEEGIGFTVINPGNVATDEVLADIEAGRFKKQTPIPLADLINVLEMILMLSKDVEIGDINLIQKDH